MNLEQLKEFVCLENRKKELDAEQKQVKQQLDDLEQALRGRSCIVGSIPALEAGAFQQPSPESRFDLKVGG